MVVTYHVPRALLCISGMGGMRWVILASGVSGLPDIIAPWFLEVDYVKVYGNQWGPSLMLYGVPDGEYAGQGSAWTAFDVGKCCVRQIEKQMYCTVTRWSLAAHRCLFSMGTRTRGVSRLRWVRIVCVDVRTFWRPCFCKSYFGLSSLIICIWGEYANPFTARFREEAHYVDGFKWPKSLVGDVSTRELCMAHWNVWRHL